MSCARCHHPKPNGMGCAVCDPETLGVRLKEALADIKELRADRDAMKTWSVALYAHVCRLTGADPRNGPKEIVQLAADHERRHVEAGAESIRIARAVAMADAALWCEARAAEHHLKAEENRETTLGVTHVGGMAAALGIAEGLRELAAFPESFLAVPVQLVDDAKFAVMKAVGFISERFGNNDGADWADANAADVCDGLDQTLTALSATDGEAEPVPEKPPCPECSDLPFRDPCSICDAPRGG